MRRRITQLKYFLIIGALGVLPVESFAGKPLNALEAMTFLNKLTCHFSAFVESNDGKKVRSIAICAQSLSTKGARPHKFCYLRGVDMITGRYRGKDGYGSSLRDEKGHCSEVSIKRIFDSASSQLSFKVADGKSHWVVAKDEFGLMGEFLETFKFREDTENRKYAKYKWLLDDFNGICRTNSDLVTSHLKAGSKIVFQDDGKIGIMTKPSGKPLFLFTTKKQCEKESEPTLKM